MGKCKIIMIGLLTMLLMIAIYIKNGDSYKMNSNNNDSLKFKEEYENLNENPDYKKISVPEMNPIVYSTYEQIENIITKGTGIIYFGFPECPWCRNAVPVLLDAANEVGVNEIYYFNAVSMRDKKHLDEKGNIIVDKAGTDEYNKLIEILYNQLGEYEGLNDSTIKRLYFPTVVFVKNGTVIGLHVGTLDSQENAKNSLTDKQYKELKEIYSDYMLEVLGSICDDDTETKC